MDTKYVDNAHTSQKWRKASNRLHKPAPSPKREKIRIKSPFFKRATPVISRADGDEGSPAVSPPCETSGCVSPSTRGEAGTGEEGGEFSGTFTTTASLDGAS